MKTKEIILISSFLNNKKKKKDNVGREQKKLGQVNVLSLETPLTIVNTCQ